MMWLGGVAQPFRGLFLLLILLASPGFSKADQPLSSLANQAYDYSSRLYSGSYQTGDATQLLAQFADRIEAKDWAGAEPIGISAIISGGDSYNAWLSLSEVEENLAKPMEAALAAYIASDRAPSSSERAAALGRSGLNLEKTNLQDLALAALGESLSLAENPAIAEAYQRVGAKVPFRVFDYSATTDGDQPSACLTFDRKVPSQRKLRYEDYIRVEPEAEIAFRATGSTLCIEGLQYATTYTVRVLKGMPAETVGALAEDTELSLPIGDRNPSLGFQRQTYVMPRVGGGGVPLTSVNVDYVGLRLLRVGDRNLVQEIGRNTFLSNLYSWDIEQLANYSAEDIWQGGMKVEGERNRRVVTSIPILEMIPKLQPGVYALVATPKLHPDAAPDEDASFVEESQWGPQATQWVVVSDLGLSTISGEDGLSVFTRSLDSALPVEGVTLQLLSRSNDVLATTQTDAAGAAKFDPGLLRGDNGRTATAVLAFSGDDFSFLDLTAAAYDLSDRGVEGRAQSGDLDLFFYTDRGVYRPGETVQLVALLRDRTGAAKSGMPIWLRVVRPDGVEAAKFDNLKDSGGGFAQPIDIAESARTGEWTVEAYVDPEGSPIAVTSFLVEEVVPARIETTLSASAPMIETGKSISVDGEVKFLFGAPAKGLKIKSDVVIERAEYPVAGFDAYRFGLEEEEVESQRIAFPDATTGSDGKFSLPIALSDIPDVTAPLVGTIRVEAYEFGGRPVIESLELPVKSREVWLGVKPLFADAQVPEGSNAGFEIIAIDSEGKRIPLEGAEYRLIQEEWDYDWFYNGGSWDYHVTVRDGASKNQALNIPADAPAEIAETVNWGYFRLEVHDPKSGAATSVRFNSGWRTKPGQASTPDQLRVVADKEAYQAGDIAQVMLQAPFAGEAMVTIATDRVLETRLVSVPAEGATIDVPIDPQWAAGAYVLVNAYRPAGVNERGPGRAIGLAWLAIDPTPHALTVTIDAPDSVLPRGHVDIPVTLAGMSGEEAFVTLAAIDEGVLTLTDFATPDPIDHFFGKRRMMVDVRDLYGQLIDSKAGRRGEIREGGDSALEQRGAPAKIELVALFSGIVSVGKDGKATIGFDIPDYNGRLRLMAVAYDQEKVGWAEKGLIVHDPVVADLAAPRFLAPGDESMIALTLNNVDGPAGSYHGALSSLGDVQMGAGADFNLDLAPGATASLRVPILGQRVGEGEVNLLLDGPEGFRISRTIQIPVRPSQPPVTETVSRQLKPGEGVEIGAQAVQSFIGGTGSVRASFSTTPNLDVESILVNLDHYVYGCLEQMTSKAMPLLVASDVADLWSLENRYRQIDRAELQRAIRRILNQQRYDGLFGLWTSADPGEPWLSAYAVDFLMRAKAKGFLVSDSGINRGLDALEQLALGRIGNGDGHQRYGTGAMARSYAFYVLAKANRAKLADLRYWFDTADPSSQAPLALALLSAALAMNGDLDRAQTGFEAAIDTWRKAKPMSGEWDYGSVLRDIAAIAAVVAENKISGIDNTALLADIANEMERRRWFSTQEQAWLLRAAAANAGQSKHLRLTVSNQGPVEQDKDFVLRPEPASLATPGISVVNSGEGLVYAKVSARGNPSADLPAAEEGFLIEKKVYDAQGNPIQLEAMRQSDMAVVVLTGNSTGGGNRQALLVDLLPAGWEIENANLANTRQAQDFNWLPALTQPNYVEYRDDRFVAAFDVTDQDGQLVNKEFAFAYIVRAVTPGEYKLPAPTIEDMYQPEKRGRGAAARVVIN